jgi:molybdenum cofactor guanylyltransferase
VPRYPEVTLAILAGGQATRLGGLPKPLLRVQGRAIVDRLLDLAQDLAGALIVANAPALYLDRGVRVVADHFRDRGPTAGLHAALLAAGTEWVLLLAGDMPFVQPAAVKLLADAREPTDMWVSFARDGRMEPLPGLYRKGLLPVLEARLGSGQPSFPDIVRGQPGRQVDFGALARVDPGLRTLLGVNTPEQAAQLGVVFNDPMP